MPICDVPFVLISNKPCSKQSSCQWFGMRLRSCDDTIMTIPQSVILRMAWSEKGGYMIHGKWRVHTLCTPNNTKMADQIVIKFTRIAHRTQRTPIHTNIFVRIDDVITCPLLVEPTRHRWFHSQGETVAGALLFVQLFAWTNCWTDIRVAGGLRRHRSHFHYYNLIRTVVYVLSPTTKFYAYRGAYLHCLCLQADRQTDGQGATDNEYTPTIIPRGKLDSHRYQCYMVLVLLKVQFLEER